MAPAILAFAASSGSRRAIYGRFSTVLASFYKKFLSASITSLMAASSTLTVKLPLPPKSNVTFPGGTAASAYLIASATAWFVPAGTYAAVAFTAVVVDVVSVVVVDPKFASHFSLHWSSPLFLLKGSGSKLH